jgi:hypothetical protein
MVILGLEGVELEEDLAVADDLLVRLTSVTAGGAEHLLVEAARGGHVPDDDERLGPGLRHHDRSLDRGRSVRMRRGRR